MADRYCQLIQENLEKEMKVMKEMLWGTRYSEREIIHKEKLQELENSHNRLLIKIKGLEERLGEVTNENLGLSLRVWELESQVNDLQSKTLKEQIKRTRVEKEIDNVRLPDHLTRLQPQKNYYPGIPYGFLNRSLSK